MRVRSLVAVMALLQSSVFGSAGPAPPAAGDDTYGLRTFVQLVQKDGIVGYTTYRLLVGLPAAGRAKSVYTVYGDGDAPLELPAAFTVPPPFGSDIGGVDPAIFKFSPQSEFDSWVTVGLTDGNKAGTLTSIGINYTDWSNATRLNSADGAVFWMDPTSAPDSNGKNLTVAQLSVPNGAPIFGCLNVQGKSFGGLPDYNVQTLVFDYHPDGPAVSPNGTDCRDALTAMCSNAKHRHKPPQIMDCIECVGAHQLEAHGAGCSNTDVGAFCKSAGVASPGQVTALLAKLRSA